jgi:hypothetical protein
MVFRYINLYILKILIFQFVAFTTFLCSCSSLPSHHIDNLFNMQATTKINTAGAVPPSLNPPNWTGFAPLAAYLFSLQEYLASGTTQGKMQSDHEMEAASIHCSPVSNFSAYVSPEAAAQSATTTTWGSGVTAVAFDPTRGGSVIAVVIVEGTLSLYYSFWDQKLTAP